MRFSSLGLNLVVLLGLSPLPVSYGEAGAPASKVRVVAYINESVGCQKATVQYLKDYARDQHGAVSLEIVDFGTEEGFARWRGDGFSCQAIVINGSCRFRLGSGDGERIVVFRMPEGVRWTFDDLAAVLAEELKSPRSSVLSDAQALALAKRTPVASRQSKSNGKPVGEVVVAAQTVFRFSSSFDGKSAVTRATEAASALRKMYDSGLQSDEVHVAAARVGNKVAGVIVARGQPIAVVGDAEADLIKHKPIQAAQFWAFNLRDALRLLEREKDRAAPGRQPPVAPADPNARN
jgi:hypothetical protein